jgi:hypothetical protein
MKYYAIAELPHSNLSPEHSLTVLAFPSRARRDAWVGDGTPSDDFPEVLRTYGEVRHAAKREEAASALGRLMGGYGRACLREIDLYQPPAGWPKEV